MKVLFLLCIFYQISWNISRSVLLRNPAPCPENMRHYVDEANNSLSFCDCKETLLYYPKDDSCFDAYRQGPCPSEHYLVLPPGEDEAKCEKNPCKLDGLVPFDDDCYFLWVSELPCEVKFQTLTVNRNTFGIECSLESYNGHFSNVKISKSCSENSILVPTDEDETKWTCECRPGFLRDVKNNSCHEAFRQGSCPSGQFFILPPGEKEARCEKNPCLEDTLVPFREGCHKLFEYGLPCSGANYYLGVDEKSFQLKCFYSRRSHGYGHHGGGGIINAPIKACPAGSRRVVSHCKRVFQ